jgi:protein TonB
LPLAAALLLVGGVLWFVMHPGGHAPSNPPPAQTAEASRPLGLYVDPAGQTLRVSWNPNATALRESRTVQVFVREGDDQKKFDLAPRDLASGSYEYRPVGNDVTFRLEVVDQSGRVSAESFRLVRTANPPPVSSAPNATPPPTGAALRIVPPKPIYRAPPVVAAGVRPRIKGTIPIDVRVQIDARGHVTSAKPVTRQHSGLDEYLAGRAVQAARLWRFEPARENGKAVAGTQILHFVFEK